MYKCACGKTYKTERGYKRHRETCAKSNGNKPQPVNDQLLRWREYRCYTCGRLLFEAILSSKTDKVRSVCPRCSRMCVFVGGEHPRLQKKALALVD